MADKLCTVCHVVGRTRTKGGNGGWWGIAVIFALIGLGSPLLWLGTLFFALVAIGVGGSKTGCGKCGSPSVIPLDSPAAHAILGHHKPQSLAPPAEILPAMNTADFKAWMAEKNRK